MTNTANTNPGERIFGLAPDELEGLLESLDLADNGSNPRRQFKRLPFRQNAVRVQTTNLNGTPGGFTAVARNLSPSGVSLLHRAYIHEGTVCEIELPNNDGETQQITGDVMRCTHLTGLVHELGIKFREDIDVTKYLAVDPLENIVEHVDPGSISGTIVYADRSEFERRFLKGLIADTGCVLRCVGSAQEAVEMLNEGKMDLLLAEYWLPDTHADELVGQVRMLETPVPVIITTADDSEKTKSRIRQAGPDAFLQKPWTASRLHSAIGPFLGAMPSSDAA